MTALSINQKQTIFQQNIDSKVENNTSKIEIQEDLPRKIQSFVCQYDLSGRFDLASLLCLEFFNKLLNIPLKSKSKKTIAEPGFDMLESQFFPIFIKLFIGLKIEEQREFPPEQEFYTNKRLSSELKEKLENMKTQTTFRLASHQNKSKFEEAEKILQLLIEILNEDNAFEILEQKLPQLTVHLFKPNDKKKQLEQLKRYSKFITRLISHQGFNKFSKSYLEPIIEQHSQLASLQITSQPDEIRTAYIEFITKTMTMSQLMHDEIQQENQGKEEEEIFDLQIKKAILIFILDFSKCKIQALEQLFLQQKPGYRSSIELSEKFFSLLQRYAKKLNSKKVTKNPKWENFETEISTIELYLNVMEHLMTEHLPSNFWEKEVLNHDSSTMMNILFQLQYPICNLKGFYKTFENIPEDLKKNLESLISKVNTEDCEDAAAYLVKRLSSHRVFILFAALFHVANLLELPYLDKGNLDAPDEIKNFFHWLNELQENAQKTSTQAKKKEETTSICSSTKEKEEIEKPMNSDDATIQENVSELKEEEPTANPSVHEKPPHHSMKPRKFKQLLNDLGFSFKRQKGSHQFYEDINGRHILYTPHRERRGFKPGNFHAMMDSLKA
ncbi:MAG: hypothetical protein K1000chlam3_00662 [Chlamydiae bacterium]|nr:hypothetical protein [Chlamydiota bacterium]